MKTELQKWRGRHDLPVIKKLDFKVDLEALKTAYQSFSSNKVWNSLGSEYAGLCETHTKLPKMFFKKEELENVDHICNLDWEHASYKQLSLTEFNSEFALDQRSEMSGSAWDHRIAKNKKDADERFFNKIKDDVPLPITDILKSFRGAHRSRFASLAPQSQVKPHIDYDTLYGIRLHVALETNPGCLNGGWDKDGNETQVHIPADGSVWFVNPGLKHYAINSGDSDRVHLIISVDSQELIWSL